MFGFFLDADVFYPSDLLDEYKNMSVKTENGSYKVSLNKYRCRRKDYGGTEDAEEVKDGFINASKKAIISEAGGARPYVGVFVGKGSVAEIITVLGLVPKYKEQFVKLFKKQGGPKGDCAKLLDGYGDDKVQDMLQAFADKYLGLDCNGFVGNYVKRLKKSSLGPDNEPKAYYEHRKGLRKTVADVVNLDIVVWENFTHIAIIDSFESDLETVNLCQSTGGGPQNTPHNLVANKAKNGLFTFSPRTKVGGQVYVVTLNL